MNANEEFNPEEYIFSKKHSCPVCDNNFENSFLRSSKLKFVKSDTDLKAYYKPFDPLYYDVVLCPYCGYSALSQTFKSIGEKQSELILANISPKFINKTYPLAYSAADAVERYKFALLSAMIKNASQGEKAYICLKLAWVYRDKGDHEEERRFLLRALEGFSAAYQSEEFPICCMDENTVTYLLGELNRRCGNYEEALRFISRLAAEKDISPRLKERAVEVKDLIRQESKES